MKRILLKRIRLLLILTILCSSFSIHLKDSFSARDEKVKSAVKDYVQQVVISSVLEMMGKTIERLIRTNNIQIFPVIAQNAVQQASMQIFKQETTKQITRDAYEKTLDKAIKQLDQGIPQDTIQKSVKDSVDEVLRAIPVDPIFKRIVEEILDHSINEQHRILAMAAAQRQAQMMVLQQQYQMAQQAVMQAYQQAVVQQFIQQQAQKEMITQKSAQMHAQEAYYKQQEDMMQAQYEKNMRREYEKQMNAR